MYVSIYTGQAYPVLLGRWQELRDWQDDPWSAGSSHKIVCDALEQC